MAKRKRRTRCGFTKSNPKGNVGRRANGTLKPGYKIGRNGRVRKARKKR